MSLLGAGGGKMRFRRNAWLIDKRFTPEGWTEKASRSEGAGQDR